MSKTIHELATEFHISRNGVEMRIKRIPNFRRKYAKIIGNKTVISDKGCKILKRNSNGSNNGYINRYINSYLIRDYRYRMKSLKKESSIEKKHNQQNRILLEQSNEHEKNMEQLLAKMERLLDHQQELQLNSERQNKLLRGKIKQMSNNNDHWGVHQSAQNKSHRRGFWSRLFGRN